MRYILLAVLACLLSSHLYAQGGIRGQVTDQSTGDPLIGVYIRVINSTKGAESDFDGNYSITDLAAGNYTLVFQYGGYLADTIPGVQVSAGKLTELNLKMQDQAAEIGTITIKGERVAITNDVALIGDIKTSDVVVTGISQQQMNLSQDRSAGDAIRRVSGVTLQGGSFVNIRGLSERYNVVMLNNVIAPSTETDRRAFDFGIVPSSMLDRITVYRSPSPELYADMGGGIVRIYTRNVPEKNTVTASLSGSWRFGTTGQEALNHDRPGGFALGLYNGDNDLPGSFPEKGTVRNASGFDATQRAELGKQLSNDLDTKVSTIGPDVRASMGYGTRFPVGKALIGTSTILRYSNAHQYFDVERDEYAGTERKLFEFDDKNYTHTTSIGILHNWSAVLDENKNHKLYFRNLFSQNNAKQTVVRLGGNLEDNAAEEARYSFSQEINSIYSGQLSGEHDLSEALRTKIEWTAAYNYANKNIPDWRQYVLIRPIDSTDFFLNATAQVGSRETGSRFYSENTENTYIGLVNLTTAFKFLQRDAELKYGFYYEAKDRNFDSRLLGIQYRPGANNVFGDFSQLRVERDQLYRTNVFAYGYAPDKYRANGGLQLEELTQPQDSYTADQKLYAGYLAVGLPITARLRVFGGARYESSVQTLESEIGNGASGDPLKVDNPFDIWMPTATLTYRFSDQHSLRGSYSKTLNRPELRELAPFEFYIFEYNQLRAGNPALKTATINHYELRYEFYPTLGDLITLGGFYKDFTDPIEYFLDPRSQLNSFNLINADRAQSFGVEVEIRKNLGFIDSTFRNFSLIGNAALIRSRVEIKDQALKTLLGDNADRPLQGQAPYVINAGLYYENEKLGLGTSVQYNVVGPNIAFVGNVNDPAIFNTPRHLLDFTLRKDINRWFSANVGMQNILNAEFIQVQDTNGDNTGQRNGDDRSILRYFEQPYLTVGFSMNLQPQPREK